MEKFTNITSVAAPMPIVNIDTDMIIPKQYLKTIHKSGLGEFLFSEMRYDENNQPIASFVLNQDDYKNAKIIVAEDNFGCGSSREHAPWALYDFGIRVIISTSFADIFFNNSAKNGILCIIVNEQELSTLMQAATNKEELDVNLKEQKINTTGGVSINFNMDSAIKDRLLQGLDDIAMTLQSDAQIKQYEEARRAKEPWIFL